MGSCSKCQLTLKNGVCPGADKHVKRVHRHSTGVKAKAERLISPEEARAAERKSLPWRLRRQIRMVNR